MPVRRFPILQTDCHLIVKFSEKAHRPHQRFWVGARMLENPKLNQNISHETSQTTSIKQEKPQIHYYLCKRKRHFAHSIDRKSAHEI
jgi:hypothetical protein